MCLGQLVLAEKLEVVFQLGLGAQPVAIATDSRAVRHWRRRRLSPAQVNTALSAEEGLLAGVPHGR